MLETCLHFTGRHWWRKMFPLAFDYSFFCYVSDNSSMCTSDHFSTAYNSPCQSHITISLLFSCEHRQLNVFEKDLALDIKVGCLESFTFTSCFGKTEPEGQQKTSYHGSSWKLHVNVLHWKVCNSSFTLFFDWHWRTTTKRSFRILLCLQLDNNMIKVTIQWLEGKRYKINYI